MPRLILLPNEKHLLGLALLVAATERKLDAGAALAEAALTTAPELKTLVQTFLLARKAEDQARFAATDAEAAASKATFTSEIAAIDSTLAKL